MLERCDPQQGTCDPQDLAQWTLTDPFLDPDDVENGQFFPNRSDVQYGGVWPPLIQSYGDGVESPFTVTISGLDRSLRFRLAYAYAGAVVAREARAFYTEQEVTLLLTSQPSFEAVPDTTLRNPPVLQVLRPDGLAPNISIMVAGVVGQDTKPASLNIDGAIAVMLAGSATFDLLKFTPQTREGASLRPAPQPHMRTAGNRRRTPPPPAQSDHRGKKQDLQSGKSCPAIFLYTNFCPPPPPARNRCRAQQEEKERTKGKESFVVVGSPRQERDPADAHPGAYKSVLESANPRMDSECASGCPWSTARATAPSPGRPTPGVVKQDKSSGGSVDTTKFGPTEGQNEQWREANRRRQRQTTEYRGNVPIPPPPLSLLLLACANPPPPSLFYC